MSDYNGHLPRKSRSFRASYASLDLPSPDQREKLVLWMVRRNIHFAELDDILFRDFMFGMNPNVKLLSKSSARSDVVKLYDKG
jgi:hypothetical protein